jgi:hypothetical protein
MGRFMKDPCHFAFSADFGDAFLGPYRGRKWISASWRIFIPARQPAIL